MFEICLFVYVDLEVGLDGRLGEDQGFADVIKRKRNACEQSAVRNKSRCSSDRHIIALALSGCCLDWPHVSLLDVPMRECV